MRFRLSREYSQIQEEVEAQVQAQAAAGPSLTVTIDLDPSMTADITGNETLFVFARAVNGPPMPLAIQRRSASELPLTVTLDDSMSMIPAMKLSSFPVVTVGARISRTGDAIAQSGDLQGLVMGSVAHKVAHGAECTVISVR